MTPNMASTAKTSATPVKRRISPEFSEILHMLASLETQSTPSPKKSD